MKIIVPAMYPFPQIVFDADKETLTAIAEMLTVIHMNGSTDALCCQIMDLDESVRRYIVCTFVDAMSDALGDCGFATTWAEQYHGLDWDESARFRPAWAKHMAAYINEGLSK